MELYKPDRSKPKAFICDIDGTVATHGDERSHFDYTKVLGDRPNWPVIHVVQALISTEIWVPLFVSGREEFSRTDTLNWLDAYVFPGRRAEYKHVFDLFMRPNKDYRKDFLIKNEILENQIAPKFWVEFAIDDRTQVVQMWRGVGLPCLQVADGSF